MGSNFLRNCRLCATKCEECVGVFIFHQEGVELGIESKIRRYLRLEVRENDDLPQKVCNKCSGVLIAFHKFAEDSLRIQNRLMNLRVSLRMKTLSEIDIENDLENILTPEPQPDPDLTDEKEQPEHIEVNVDVETLVNQSSASEENSHPISIEQQEDTKTGKRRSRKQSRPIRTVVSDNEDESDFTPPPKKQKSGKKVGRPKGNKDEKSPKITPTRGRGRGRGRGRVPSIKLKIKEPPLTPPEPIDDDSSDDDDGIEDDVPLAYLLTDSDNEVEDTSENILQSEEELSSFYKFPCHLCEEVCESFSTLVSHCSESHNEESVVVTCTCGKTLTSLVELSKHKEKHDKSQFKCAKCKRCFKDKNRLESHINTHIPKSQRPFQCTQCNKRFHTEVLVRQHEKTHVPVEMRAIWQCDICNKKLCTKNSLETHQKNIHMGERSYVCDICGRTFTQKGILKDHLVTHSDETPFSCDKCGKRFKTKPRLKIHLEVHREDPLVCPVCGMQLATSRTLRIHMATHSNDRPYSCIYCGKGFKRSKDLKGHYNYHEGKKPYQCRYCGRCFANTGNCRSHKRRMHAEELRKDGRPAMTKKGVPLIPDEPVLTDPRKDSSPVSSEPVLYHNHSSEPGVKLLSASELNNHPSVLIDHVATTSALMNVALFQPPHFGAQAYTHHT